MKLLLRILLYVSLIFLLVYLYSKKLLFIPELQKPGWFIVSVGILFGGYFLDVKAWQIIVRTELPRLTYKDAFISTGKFIFSKYVPGKFWVIIGKAGYLKEKYNHGFINLTSFSLYYQLISIFSATLIGLIVLYSIDINWFLGIGISMLVFVIFISFCFEPTISFTSRILSFVFKKEIKLPYISSKTTIQLSLFSIINWLVWSLAFYLFLRSVQDIDNVHLKAGLLFPLSSVVGIIVIIAPGGLGFREGFLTLGLTALGLTAKDAASVAVLSRLWFLIGEVFIFLIAIILDWKNKKAITN